MRILIKNQMSETYLIGILLTIAGGYFDAYTYISRGKVFANAQTGNIVLLGLNFANKEYKSALYYIFPILAFAIGIFISETIRDKFKRNNIIHWRQITIFIETLILIIVGFIPIGKLNIIANILISFVCSIQVQSFRKIEGNTMATTMCTGNLRSGTELFYYGIKMKDFESLKKSIQYGGIIAFFIFGAFIGTIFTKVFLEKAILMACLLFIIVFIIMFFKHSYE